MSEQAFLTEIPQAGQRVKITIPGTITDLMDEVVEKTQECGNLYRIFLKRSLTSWRIKNILCATEQGQHNWTATFKNEPRDIFVKIIS